MAEIKTIHFSNYKSFDNEFSSFKIKRANILIGRNNSGKTSCIDIIENTFSIKKLNEFLKNEGNIKVDVVFSSDELISILEMREKTNITTILGDINEYKNEHIQYFLSTGETHNTDMFNVIRVLSEPFINNKNVEWDSLNRVVESIIKNSIVLRINAERDINPEIYNENIELFENGNGACNIINMVLNDNSCDEKLIKTDLLNALNSIISPDSFYNDIVVQRIAPMNSNKWEIYLYEGEKRYPLSKMGSGLKTIILVLLNLIVIPRIKEYCNKTIYYAFEELENNLHPALQRRLFDYLYHYLEDNDNTYLFLTTHSHVAINSFYDKENTQLLHITKENNTSYIRSIDNYFSRKEVLDDLDVRASDLYQSNGIIWVEGPSDRIYIKRWLELWGDHSIKEGVDYQFLYYGGRLLSHYTANVETTIEEMISILMTNANSAIVIDSDITNSHTEINSTKKRIRDEFESKNMYCWITAGKEIENYISYKAINEVYNSDLTKQCKRYQIFPNYIKSVRKNFSSEKVEFAKKVIPYIKDDNSKSILDVRNRIVELSDTIKKWNHK